MSGYNFLPFAFFEKKMVPFKEANISIATHALHYGTGAFGGMRGIVNPQNSKQILLFRLDKHAKRLSQSGRFLHFEISPDYIAEKIQEFIKTNKPASSFYIRPLLYTSDLGISPRLHDMEKDFLIYGVELGSYLSEEGVTCRFSSWVRQEDASFPLRGKITGGYITSSLAKTEAFESGFDEAILLNSQGKVSEATGMNIFMVRDGKLITPGFDQDILEGITRSSLLEIAKNLGIETVERIIDKSELLIADEVFLCGTAAKVTPVTKIENYKLPADKPLTNKLREKFNQIVENKDPSYNSWITVVDL